MNPTSESREDPALSEQQEASPQTSNVTPIPQKKPFDKNDPSTWGKVQRNALCPCGSGKKYKHCHGKIGAIAKEG